VSRILPFSPSQAKSGMIISLSLANVLY